MWWPTRLPRNSPGRCSDSIFSATVYPRLSVLCRGDRATIRRGRRRLATAVAMDAHDALHRAVGWTVFLQELWGEPRLSLGRFYRARSYRLERFRRMIDRAGTTATVEITDELPGIAGRNSPLDLEVRLAGIPLTTIRVVSGRRRVDSEKLRSFINAATGMELCRVAVREAVIGIPLDDPRTLRERLRAQARAAGSRWPRPEAGHGLATLILPRWPGSPIGSAASRRAPLPCSIPATRRTNAASASRHSKSSRA